MVKKSFGSGFGRLTRPKNPFARAERPANWLVVKQGKAAPVHLEKPKNRGQVAANQALAARALDEHLCLAFTYDRLPRVVEVHTIGITTADRPAMNVWQIDGESEDGSIPDWRTFCFDECFDVRLTDLASAAPRPEFKKGARQFRRIIAEA